jgi:hypothetical protein
MEICEIISYYIHENSRRLDVSFRMSHDDEDEVRNDIINIGEAEEFGYNLIQEGFELYDEDEEEYDDFDDFETIDEETLITYLNEYYIVNPDKLPKPELF